MVLEDVPELMPATWKVSSKKEKVEEVIVIDDDSDDSESVSNVLAGLSLGRARSASVDSEDERSRRKARSKKSQPTSTMSRITQAARNEARDDVRTGRKSKVAPKVSNPYISREAHCDEDLLDSSAENEGEEEEDDTDLSGFIVDDDAEITFHDSGDGVSSDESEREVRPRRRIEHKVVQTTSRRRLVRGRKKQVSDDDEDSDGLGLSKALNGMNLGDRKLQQEKNADRRKTLEVIDLTSSPVSGPSLPVNNRQSESEPEQLAKAPAVPVLDPFAFSNIALQLQPSTKNTTQLLPSKNGPLTASPERPSKTTASTDRPTTPPATPPRSPSKLRSPTKLKSPTKNLLSPAKHHKAHRQSTDAFWDHNTVNEWTDTYSPKKAPLLSPRKNPLAHFNLYADDDIENLSDEELPSQSQSLDSSQDSFNESSDSLPSPCDSPTKSRSPSKSSTLKTETSRLRDEKRAKLATKKKFDSEKHQMAIDLLMALDVNITSSKISTLSKSTGGIKLVWSKTLRSTAGRANWKRTVSKLSASPLKGNPDSASIEKEPGVIVQHFASIELAEKIIDRPERLVNTLAHEFCHLANFMVSGIRDQPHGASFQQWGKKVTSWLKSSDARKFTGWRQEWRSAEVTTKHSYVVETKYLWVCTGRPKEKMGLAARMLELEGEEGCGAEYGRHSKSIDVAKQRCGVCKGFLVQVRPAPRGASPKKSPVKGGLRTLREESSGASSVGSLEKLLEQVDLSD